MRRAPLGSKLSQDVRERDAETTSKWICDFSKKYLRRLGNRNPGIDGEDVSQRFVVSILKGQLDTYDRRRDPRPLVRACLRNSSRDLKRRTQVRQAGTLPVSYAVASESPPEAAMRRETERRVRRELIKLPRMMKRVLIAKYWKEMKVEEIAQRLKIRAGAVNRLAFLGRKRLGKVFGLQNRDRVRK